MPTKLSASVAVRPGVLGLLVGDAAEGKLEFVSYIGPEFTQYVKADIGCELITHISCRGSNSMLVSWVVKIRKGRRSYRSEPLGIVEHARTVRLMSNE